MTLELRRLRGRGKARAAAALLGRALADDPFSVWFIPDARRRRRAVRLIERATVADAQPFGEVHGAFHDGEFVGATAWLPPGAHRQDRRRQIRQLPSLAWAAVLMRGRAADAVRIADAERSIHPDVPHWWLVVVGVDPASQGIGAGGLMVEAFVGRADADGLPGYLRTTNERNLSFYRRYGFEVRDEVRATPDAPPMWLLWREPRMARSLPGS